MCLTGTAGSNNIDRGQIEGTTLGRLAQGYGEGSNGFCSSYEPGLAVPPGETLRCVQTGASADPLTCTITGVQTKK